MLMTFHPYPDFESSIACLDDKRLSRLRENVLEILTLLSKKRSVDDKLPPGVRMWEGHVPALVMYGCEVCRELSRRGKTVAGSFDKIRGFIKGSVVRDVDMPEWLESKELHTSHRSRLISKNGKLYAKYKWKVKKDLPLFWPSKTKLKGIKAPDAWTIDEMIKSGWHLRINYHKKENLFQAKVWIGEVEELPIHQLYGAAATTVERAIENVVSHFMREMQ